ncbi:D-alanine--D-alanine ligase family protein [Spirochaeta africana]|uniref:D-alanine--D-alanine ligase n=1 Tax=Spirochaeta africana (strain ATCC 700263 / DSM 8902 / Z-7692) TaxID=889378 RepID=H9UJT0_SPIAZ|nr:D-alanine--D-alanine ligase family protein [Spirochaeta africana]AFG37773.1 D-alanine--D-alanine ligase [Spirochaeta africana DSM 8902]
MRTAIIYGGRSGEHDVSCVSAASVLRWIDRSRFEPVPIGIDRSGSWYLQSIPDDIHSDGHPLAVAVPGQGAIGFQPGSGLTCNGRSLDIDIVFPVLHGTFGEDGTIQGLLDMLDLAYVGSGVLGSSLSMDKVLTKQIWEQHGLPVVPYIALQHHHYLGDPARQLDRIIHQLELPVFIKPARGGSSVGVHKAHDRQELENCLADAFRYDTKLILEKSVTATEIECSVLGNREPEVFPPASITPTHEYYDYEAKYQDPDGAHFSLPADIPAHVADRISQLALKAFVAVEARGLSRVDFFYSEQTGELYLNEINTMPGFTAISLFPRMCEHGGLPYQQLITRLIELAREEHTLRDSLRYSR